MQICDSSDDDEEVKPTTDAATVKKEKENKTPSPQKSEAKQSNGNNSGGRRRIKVKKTVTRSYEDEDGFISMLRELLSERVSFVDFSFFCMKSWGYQ